MTRNVFKYASPDHSRDLGPKGSLSFLIVLPGRMIAAVNWSDYVLEFCYAILAAEDGIELGF